MKLVQYLAGTPGNASCQRLEFARPPPSGNNFQRETTERFFFPETARTKYTGPRRDPEASHRGGFRGIETALKNRAGARRCKYLPGFEKRGPVI
ncbi:hypothetical protein EVAR_39702_1 [Eumeta japonica]|uniref:Uncharacterized protein n=1 Tax=Eumeta variegata TaxID=151549 RepID=A0A4C1W854_EUMVA|nr:hypothetical protein EVAR_39702_1 [Eumeta japonica]